MKKHTLKRVTSAVLAGLMTLSLAACGGGDAAENTQGGRSF